MAERPGRSLSKHRRSFEGEIVSARKSSLIDDRPILIEIHVEREICHGHIGELQSPLTASARVPGIEVLVRIGNLEDRPALCNSDCVDRHLALLPMEGQVEAVGKQFLIHLPHLLEVRNAGNIWNSVDIVSIFAKPLRSANDLFDRGLHRRPT